MAPRNSRRLYDGETMAFRSLTLPDSAAGRLWLSPMPGRVEPWEQFLAEARRAGLSQVVCLNPLHEIAADAPAYHAAIVQGRLPFAWRHLPMRNFGLADDEAAWNDAMRQIAQGLVEGQHVLLHCAAGIGRTGTAAACLLKCLGLPTAEALQRVRDAGSNPENALQSGRIERF
jgi:protein-tyrosine phosphatase